jgi:hypothetical protein
MRDRRQKNKSKNKKHCPGDGRNALCTRSDWSGSTPENCGGGAAAAGPQPATSAAASAPTSGAAREAREGGATLLLLSSSFIIVAAHAAPPAALLLAAWLLHGFRRWATRPRGIAASVFVASSAVVIVCVLCGATSALTREMLFFPQIANECCVFIGRLPATEACSFGIERASKTLPLPSSEAQSTRARTSHSSPVRDATSETRLAQRDEEKHAQLYDRKQHRAELKQKKSFGKEIVIK